MRRLTVGLAAEAFRRPEPAVDATRRPFEWAALAAARTTLRQAIETDGAPIIVIGHPGVGKSTLLRMVAADVAAADGRVAFWDGGDTARCYPASPADILERAGPESARGTSRVLLLVDDAQDLPDDTLDALCGGAEAPEAPRCSLVLAGTPTLLGRIEVLRRASAPLQRIQLHPLASREVPDYVRHRLRTGGFDDADLFTPAALDLVALLSRGVPADVDRLCAAALLLADLDARTRVDLDLVQEAAADAGLLGAAIPPPQRRERGDALVVAALPAPGGTPRTVAVAPVASADAPRRRRRLRARGLLFGGGLLAVSVVATVLLTTGDPVTPASVVSPPPTAAADGPAADTADDPGQVATSVIPPVAKGEVVAPAAEPVPSAPAVVGTEPEPVPEPLVEEVPTVVPPPGDDGTVLVAGLAVDAPAALARGDQLLALRDYAAARLMYRFAADRGSGAAALKLAETYDPLRVDPRLGPPADRDQAIRWYTIAAERGEAVAGDRLRALER